MSSYSHVPVLALLYYHKVNHINLKWQLIEGRNFWILECKRRNSKFEIEEVHAPYSLAHGRKYFYNLSFFSSLSALFQKLKEAGMIK